MSLNLKHCSVIFLFFVTWFINGCGTVPPPPTMTPKEQMTADTRKTKGVMRDFEKMVQYEYYPDIQKYLDTTAEKIAKVITDFGGEKVVVKIHNDNRPELRRIFSFPGVTISIPLSYLREVNFENELAAVFALELAHIQRRDLATQVELNEKRQLLGPMGVFRYKLESRLEAIKLGTDFLYNAGYDPRGMVANFQKHSDYYIVPENEALRKELDKYVKEAQKAKNEFMPSLQPIVRSNDFLRMKKRLVAHE